MKNTIELSSVINTAKAKQLRKNLLADLKTLDQILGLGGDKVKGEVKTPVKSTRNKRGHSFRLDPVILSLKGEFTTDQAAEACAKEKLIENVETRGELHNAINRLVKNGRVVVVKSGLGRAKASYKVSKTPPKPE